MKPCHADSLVEVPDAFRTNQTLNTSRDLLPDALYLDGA
jgi:hypothetical protein